MIVCFEMSIQLPYVGQYIRLIRTNDQDTTLYHYTHVCWLKTF